MLWPLIGIFVGGRGLRMGGLPKANLKLCGRSILERTLDACSAAGATSGAAPRIYLVGESSAYAAPGVQRLADEPAGVGPMGGLRALLLLAERHGVSAIALAGDMPLLSSPLVLRLAFEAPEADAFAPREGPRWQPLFARYRPRAVLPRIDTALERGETSLQVLFHRLGPGALVLELSGAERDSLVDWDRPSDMSGPI